MKLKTYKNIVSAMKCPAGDNTLLTVDFNLRKSQHDEYAAKSRRDDTLSIHCAVPAGLCSVFVMLAFP